MSKIEISKEYKKIIFLNLKRLYKKNLMNINLWII